MGGTPVRSSVGKETKLPPPATELRTPATKAAENRINASCRCTERSFRFQVPSYKTEAGNGTGSPEACISRLFEVKD
jgi:hypothetical protein